MSDTLIALLLFLSGGMCGVAVMWMWIVFSLSCVIRNTLKRVK